MAEMRTLPWRCSKCGRNKVEIADQPMDRLQPTLDPLQRIGYCSKCKQRRLFIMESSA